jgi:transcriptional regulator with XRE-family HTH domain
VSAEAGGYPPKDGALNATARVTKNKNAGHNRNRATGAGGEAPAPAQGKAGGSPSDRLSGVLALQAAGLNQKQIAAELGVSESTVSRTLQDHQAGNDLRPAQAAVDAFVESLGVELAPAVAARVEALRTLAAKLDWAHSASTGTAAMAAAGVAKEFRALLDELQAVSSFDELRAALLAGDDDAR